MEGRAFTIGTILGGGGVSKVKLYFFLMNLFIYQHIRQLVTIRGGRHDWDERHASIKKAEEHFSNILNAKLLTPQTHFFLAKICSFTFTHDMNKITPYMYREKVTNTFQQTAVAAMYKLRNA